MKQNNTLPSGGGLQRGGITLPAGKPIFLRQGGGLRSGGGMKGINQFAEEDDIIASPATSATSSPATSATSSPVTPPISTRTAAVLTPFDLTAEQSKFLKDVRVKVSDEALAQMLTDIQRDGKVLEDEGKHDLTKAKVLEILDKLNDPTVLSNSNTYTELRRQIRPLFKDILKDDVATGVIGLPKIAKDSKKIKTRILSQLPPDLTPDKYKDDAKRQASQSAPSSSVEVIQKLQQHGMNKGNFELFLNNPVGHSSAQKAQWITKKRNEVLDAFNVSRDAKVRSRILSAHSNAKKNEALGETNNNEARVRLITKDLIAYMKDKLKTTTKVKKGGLAKQFKQPKKKQPVTLGDLNKPLEIEIEN
jgi:hypothetical protein